MESDDSEEEDGCFKTWLGEPVVDGTRESDLPYKFMGLRREDGRPEEYLVAWRRADLTIDAIEKERCGEEYDWKVYFDQDAASIAQGHVLEHDDEEAFYNACEIYYHAFRLDGGYATPAPSAWTHKTPESERITPDADGEVVYTGEYSRAEWHHDTRTLRKCIDLEARIDVIYLEADVQFNAESERQSEECKDARAPCVQSKRVRFDAPEHVAMQKEAEGECEASSPTFTKKSIDVQDDKATRKRLRRSECCLVAAHENALTCAQHDKAEAVMSCLYPLYKHRRHIFNATGNDAKCEDALCGQGSVGQISTPAGR